METKSATFTVFAENLPRLREKVEELNRKIARLAARGYALAPLKLAEGASHVVKVRRYNAHGEPGAPFEAVKVEVTLEGPSVRAEGWEFVASVQHLGEAGNILRAVPGFEGLDLAAYRESPPSCDHCETNRLRKDTFVLRAVEGGAMKRVGRSCLAEFLGIDPFRFAHAAEYLAAVRGCADEWDGEFERGGTVAAWGTAEYLRFVACAIRTSGWLSRTKARELGGTASADLAISCGVCDPHHGDSKESLVPSAEDHALAEAALAWVTVYFDGGHCRPDSDYEQNVRVALLAGYVTARTAGLIASVIPWYQRATERERLAAREKASAHVGEVGKRSVFSGLKLVSVRSIESFYGVSRLHKFVDPAGNVFTWFCSGSSPFEEGQSYEVAASVKKHDEFRGVKQTVLLRCSVAKPEKPKKARPAKAA